MKNIFLFLAITCLLISCNRSKQDTTEAESPVEQVEKEAEEQADEVATPDTELGFMVAYEGKYAGQEELFKNPVLAERLRNLDRFNYEAMLERWNTETPIIIEDGILHMSGCKAHDCPSSAYDFFLDVENDNINIYNFRSNMLRLYQESGMIALPPGFAVADRKLQRITAFGTVEL